jgi:hypothetical protein
MSKDLENATKAAQCAALLCDDMIALVSSDNLILSDLAMQHLGFAQNIKADLDRLVANIKQMDKRINGDENR